MWQCSSLGTFHSACNSPSPCSQLWKHHSGKWAHYIVSQLDQHLFNRWCFHCWRTHLMCFILQSRDSLLERPCTDQPLSVALPLEKNSICTLREKWRVGRREWRKEREKKRERQRHGRVITHTAEEDNDSVERGSLESMVDTMTRHYKRAYINLSCLICV